VERERPHGQRKHVCAGQSGPRLPPIRRSADRRRRRASRTERA
jgi:hypothetical protein